MKTATGGHREPIRLDRIIEVPGALVGTDPYRRWGPILRWAVIGLEFPIMGGPNWHPFDKLDVVVVDITRTQEFYREGPFSARTAARRETQIVASIKTDGLDKFVRRMQIEQSTLGPVSARSGRVSGLQQVKASLGLWRASIRDHGHGGRQD
jgi:hypothetical protein